MHSIRIYYYAYVLLIIALSSSIFIYLQLHDNRLHIVQPSNTTSNIYLIINEWATIIKYILDFVLDGCTIYKLLLVLTQRDVRYQKINSIT